jgi:hypothetical protein
MKNASPGHIRDGIILSQVQPREYAAFATEQLPSTYAAATPSLYTIDRSALLHRYQRLALPLASGRSLPSILLTYARWNTRAADEVPLFPARPIQTGQSIAASVAVPEYLAEAAE